MEGFDPFLSGCVTHIIAQAATLCNGADAPLTAEMGTLATGRKNLPLALREAKTYNYDDNFVIYLQKEG